MIIQHFDPVDHSISEFVSFWECPVPTESIDPMPKKKNVTIDNDDIKPKHEKRKKSSSSEVSANYILHGENCGHSSH